MTIDRVATNAQSQFMLQQIMQAASALDTTQAQVATGKKSTTYSGIGNQTEALQAAQSALDRTNGYQAATQVALNQANLQDAQLTQLSTLANQLRQDITEADGNDDASQLMTQVDGIYSQIVGILNTKDADGNYIYGGGNENAPPVSATSLSQLGSLTSASDAFVNGSSKTAVRISDNTTVTVGMLASDIGGSLISTIKGIVDFNNGANGNLGKGLSQPQQDFLATAIQNATSAAQDVNMSAAKNGQTYSQLNDASSSQQSLATLYTGFVSNIQDVDMGKAVADLNMDQTALQAALQVTSQLNQISLLNYLPINNG